MSYKDGFDQLIADLAKTIGMDALKFDEDKFCHITVDDEFPVSIRRDDETQQLVLLGQVTDTLPDEFDREVLLQLLNLGLGPLRTHGIGMGYETETKQLILHQSIPLGELNLERLQVMLANFFENIKEWRGKIHRAPAPLKTQGSASPTLRPHGFL